MVWNRDGKKAELPAAARVEEHAKDASETLIAALNAFKEEVRERLSSGPNPDVEAARRLVAEAKRVIDNTGVGRAFVPVLMAEVRHYPTWSKRDDSDKWNKIGATDITGSERKEGKSTVSVCEFTRGGHRWKVEHWDEGYSTALDDNTDRFGRAELSYDNKVVLGLKVTEQFNLYYSEWSYIGLSNLQVGPWMKDLIEMESCIKHQHERYVKDIRKSNDLATAKNISL